MILVNLLPQEHRVREKRKIDIPYRPVAIGIFAIFLVIALYNLFLFIRLREEHRSLKKQWTPLAERNAQAELLERELGSTVLAEVDFYDTLVDPPLETAKVLNLISDLIPKDVWLTALKFNRREKELQLILNGLSEASGRSSKLLEIQNFANGLKNQMEPLLSRAAQADPNLNLMAQKTLEAVVTTTSQKEQGSETGERTQFTATFSTPGFDKIEIQ